MLTMSGRRLVYVTVQRARHGGGTIADNGPTKIRSGSKPNGYLEYKG